MNLHNAEIQGFEFWEHDGSVEAMEFALNSYICQPYDTAMLTAALRQELKDHPEPLGDDGARQDP